MEITETNNKEKWNNFVTNHPKNFILQSWQWAKFQEKLGRKTKNLLWEEDGQPVAAALMIKRHLIGPFSFLYSPRPLLTDDSLGAEVQAEIFHLLGKWIGNLDDPVFVRIEPGELKNNQTAKRLFETNGFTETNITTQPHYTLKIDLRDSEDEILSQMKEKGCYNIRVAQRKEVEIREHRPEDLNIFLDMLHKTAKRAGFTPHSDKYLQTQFEALYPEYEKLFIAWHKDTPIATLITGFFGDKAYYLHGAMSYEHRELMGTYLIQWHAMKKAKEMGKTVYDMWGIHPDPDHPLAGVTRFKRKFGGFEEAYLPTFEAPVKNFWYKSYKTISDLRS